MAYPEDLDSRGALEMLLAACEKLQWEMGGTEASKNCTGLISKWDHDYPAIFYLERNMRWAKEVLERDKEPA